MTVSLVWNFKVWRLWPLYFKQPNGWGVYFGPVQLWVSKPVAG